MLRDLFSLTILSLAFYGLGMNNPSTISKIWNIADEDFPTPFRWATEYDQNLSVFQHLLRSGAHSLVVVSLGANLGGLAIILLINHINRKRLQWIGFLVLFFLLMVLGAIYKQTVQTKMHGVAITLYVLSQIAFNFGKSSSHLAETYKLTPFLTGPNTLTFIVRYLQGTGPNPSYESDSFLDTCRTFPYPLQSHLPWPLRRRR